MERHQGKKVVIIGGTSGMGLATATTAEGSNIASRAPNFINGSHHPTGCD